MVQIAESPAELLDLISKRVDDPRFLFPFLLSRRTHKSALLAIYENVVMHIENANQILRRARWPRNFYNNRWRMRRLRIDYKPKPAQTATDTDPRPSTAVNAETHAERFVDSFSLFTSNVEALELLEIPCHYELRHPLSLKKLKSITVTQQKNPGVADASTTYMSQYLKLNLADDVELRSLSVRASVGYVMLYQSSPLITQSLRRLEVRGVYAMRFNNTCVYLTDSDSRVLPFGNLHEFVLYDRDYDNGVWTTVQWLKNLGTLLKKSRKSLESLSVLSDSDYQASDQMAEVIDYTDYKALKRFTIAARSEQRPLEPSGLYDGEQTARRICFNDLTGRYVPHTHSESKAPPPQLIQAHY